MIHFSKEEKIEIVQLALHALESGIHSKAIDKHDEPIFSRLIEYLVET